VERGVDHPPPSSVEVKERVELYHYSPSGTSWPALGWTLLVPVIDSFIEEALKTTQDSLSVERILIPSKITAFYTCRCDFYPPHGCRKFLRNITRQLRDQTAWYSITQEYPLCPPKKIPNFTCIWFFSCSRLPYCLQLWFRSIELYIGAVQLRLSAGLSVKLERFDRLVHVPN